MAKETEDPIVSLYRDSFPDFARMIRRMGGNPEEAKDAFHDALLIYMEKEKAGKLSLYSSPKAYLLGTAKICWLHARGMGSSLALPEGFEAAEQDDTDTEEREKSLMESLVRSGKKCMELLKAFYYDHCSMQDIAVRFGFNGRRSAAVQKYKCLEKVREEIKSTHAYAQ
ncbi:MAG TPA: sigma-70 family RNA polymerase sigma factor [Puia sp.]|jgi:DNA-directed RNA polymerase specialized sigma24 family protein